MMITTGSPEAPQSKEERETTRPPVSPQLGCLGFWRE